MTAETRDELRNALDNHERQLALVMDSPSGSADTGTWAQLAMARAVTTSAMVNLEHLEHSIAASRDHEAQGSELLAMMRESSVAPADFGRLVTVVGQIVSYLEDPMGHPSAFELDREDRDTESAAHLLGFLEPDPITSSSDSPELPTASPFLVNRFLWDDERIYHAISVIRHGRPGVSDHDDEAFARDLVTELTGLDYAGRPAGPRRETVVTLPASLSPDDAAWIADAEGGFVPGVDFDVPKAPEA